jgi:hypothetical protein
MMTLATRSSAIPLAPPAKDAASAMKNAETHGVSGERDQRKGRAEDGERIADAALRQFDSNQEAERHADEGPDGSQLQLAGDRREVADHHACSRPYHPLPLSEIQHLGQGRRGEDRERSCGSRQQPLGRGRSVVGRHGVLPMTPVKHLYAADKERRDRRSRHNDARMALGVRGAAPLSHFAGEIDGRDEHSIAQGTQGVSVSRHRHGKESSERSQ